MERMWHPIWVAITRKSKVAKTKYTRYMCAYILLYLSIHLSIHPSIHPTIYLYVHAFVFATYMSFFSTNKSSLKQHFLLSSWLLAIKGSPSKKMFLNLYILTYIFYEMLFILLYYIFKIQLFYFSSLFSVILYCFSVWV